MLNKISEEFYSLGENTTHGTRDFPVGWYPDLSGYWKEYYFIPHWHRELELLVVEEGVMELVIGGKSNRLISGSLVLIPPNILHTSYRIGEKVCRYSCIVFSCEFIASRMDDSIQKEILQPLFLDDFSENYITSIIELDLKETWHILSQCLSSQDISEYLKVKGLLLQMIAEIILTKKESSFKRKEESIRAFREKEILKYIEETYSEVLHLADLADVLNLSKEQFSRFFRQSFRQSPMQYLKEFRLQKASQLLINTNLSVEEIAGLTGFDNGNYFSRVFKSNLKVAPTKFREMTRSC